MQVANTASYPVDLSDGRVLAPGERAETPANAHTKGLLDAGLLLDVDEPAAAVADEAGDSEPAAAPRARTKE